MPQTVFISYSHKDKTWKDRLLTHLRISEREGLLDLWDDQRIAAGQEWRSQIEKAIDAADIGILLISADFLTSDFIRGEEIPRMLERRSKNGMRLFPVLVRSCEWQIVKWLEPIQVRPRELRPLADFRGNRRDAEMAAIAGEIRDLLASKPAPLPTLHQLPAPPADFTGREEDLAALRSALAEGGTGAIFVLRGMGGVGKTTLALKLADELQDRYPDAQIYLDLKGVDPQPLTAAQAMAHVIRAFHPELRVPESDAELTVLYRSVLHGKRCLLLMDNASPDGRGQVGPLTPPPGSLLLVTSRFHFYVDGMVSRDLDELPEEDARKLLLKIASRIGDKADEIAQLCGRLPLALRLAGGALVERQDLSPAEYVRRLKEGKERFDKVDAALNVSYELLNMERRRLWSMLGVFPGTFNALATAAVWELDDDSALEVLGELVRSSLVEWEEKEKRYRLHDLARVFSGHRLGKSEIDACRRRHAQHFLEVLRQAADFYERGGPTLQLGLRLFNIEWGNLQAGFSWAAERILQDNVAAKTYDEYQSVGTFLLSLRQHPRERILWREQALKAARQRKNRLGEGYHLVNMGLAYADLSEARRAIELYKQGLAIIRELGNRRDEGWALGCLGNAYLALGETRHGIELLEQYLAIVRDIGDRRGEGQALRYLGNAYTNLGEPQRAIDFYEQVLTIAREMGDRRGEGQTLGNLGIAHAALGEYRRATEFYAQDFAIARELGDRRGEGQTLGNLGLSYKTLGDTRRAVEFFEQSLAIAREIGDRRAEGNALLNLGNAYKQLEPQRLAEQGP